MNIKLGLKSVLEQEEYTVFSLSFENIGQNLFSTDEKFCAAVLWLMKDAVENESVAGLSERSRSLLLNSIDDEIRPVETVIFSRILSKVCKFNERPVVLTIDEVDKASNNSSLVTFGYFEKPISCQEREFNVPVGDSCRCI